MEKEKFIALLSKKLSGQLTLKETEQLDRIILQNEEYKLLAVKLENYVQQKEEKKPNTQQLSRIWKMIEISETEDVETKFNDLQPKSISLSFKKLLKIAAVLVLLIGTSFLSYKLLNGSTMDDFETLTTTNGKTFKLLDDGTKIWLNKNSELSYNTAFGKNKREIILKGEAYFDVAKNEAIPLFIHAGNIDIEVKGTAFNVNAYQDKDDIEVALVRGLIQVTDRLDSKRTVLLHPNEKFTLNHVKNDNLYSFLVKSVDAEILLKETSWIADTLNFNKEKLVSLVVKMEKKFDVKISIQSEKLKEKRFSGMFVNENVQQALEALKLSYPLTYTINNRLVVIRDEK